MRKFGATFVAVVALGLGGGAATYGALTAGAVGPVTTFTVDDANDAGLLNPGSTVCQSTDAEGSDEETGTCTLRAALQASKNLATDTIIDLSDPTTVPNNPASVYAVNSTLGLGQLDVNDNGNTVTIDGAGQSTAIISAVCTSGECSVNTRVLKVETGTTADISGVTIEHGDPSGNIGGGILNCGTLTLSNSTVTLNTAANSGGGIEQSSGGSTTLDHVTVSDNTAGESDGGGGVDVEGADVASTMTITNSSVIDNTATDSGDGGGIEISGTDNLDTVVDIENSSINDNTSDNDNGGGISQDSVSTLTVNNSTINDNSAHGDFGGGVILESDTDAIANFNNDIINGNSAYGGGGITNFDGIVTVNNTTIANNDASEGGGGVVNWTNDFGSTTITNSTINGNTVADVGDSFFLGDGGGILSITTPDGEGCSPLTMTNDTIANNDSVTGGGFESEGCGSEVVKELTPEEKNAHSLHQGAHVSHQTASGADTAFLFDTFASNSASSSEGGGNIQITDQSTTTLSASIVAYGIVNTEPTTNCAFNEGSTFTSLGYNLIDDDTCGTPAVGDIIGHDPLLGALANNGGPTQTQLPATGSPAIGGVPNGTCLLSAVTSDQRGLPRPGGLNGTCTIGAVEVQIASPTPPPAFNPNGYRMAAFDGGVFDFGIQFHGSLANTPLNSPIIGIANSPGPDGYLLVAGDGGVFALGGANFYGSLGSQKLPSPIAAIAATPSGLGYWLASKTGTIYNFGGAPQLPAVQLPAGDHIVGIASTNDGKGLWLVDNAGDVYTEGDAQFLGSLGGKHLNAAIVGIAPAATGQGYILAAADGGVFTFGVGYFGSVPAVLHGGQKLNAPIMGIAETHSGLGYWEVGSDGGVFCFGDAPFLGSTYTQLKPGQTLNGPVVGIQHLGTPNA